ncbi:trypsin-like peptidase domain-containing protein [Chloroflexota bacterium]
MSIRISSGRHILILLLTLLLTFGCRTRGTPPVNPASEPTKSPEPIETIQPTLEPPLEPTTEPSPTPSGAVSSLADVEKAVILIKSTGMFSEPKTEDVRVITGRGSGFIIHPSGIAVTNNHIVTGAEEIEVWVGGNKHESYNAKLLAVSECYNLALIDIDGDEFEFLNWAQEPVEFAQEVYLAGFKAYQGDFSLLRGIIVNPELNGETSRTSVDSLIEYSMRADPSISGGPLISLGGKILGIHYGEIIDDRQAIGVSHIVAHEIVEQLMSGESLDSIGVNGQAFVSEDRSLGGIWISSVESDSAADKANLKAGDIITKLDDQAMAASGTLAEYCDVLRSHDPGDPINYEVVRSSTEEAYKGQLGEDEVLSLTTPVVDIKLNPDASQPGEEYFSYDFDHDIYEWDYFLTNGDPSGVITVLKDGKLKITINSLYTYAYYIYNNLDVKDVRLDIRAANLGTNNNNVSLICRHSALSWYEFNIASNGLYWIYQYDSTLSDPYKQLWNGGSFSINLGKEENEYTAICKGDQLSLLINGIEAISITDEALTRGGIGFSVSSYNVTPIVVEIDNFTASVPE